MTSPDVERKNQILVKAPFSGTYLNKSFLREMPFRWQRELQRHQSDVENRIVNQVGIDWEQRYVEPQYLRGVDLEMFHPQVEDYLNIALVRGHIAFGFEIGSRDDAKVLLPDFVGNIIADKSVNNRLFSRRPRMIEVSSELVNYIEDLLMEGVSLATVPPQFRGLGEIQTNPLDDFLSQLDLRDL